MEDFESAYMDIIRQMKKPKDMVRRMLPKVTPRKDRVQEPGMLLKTVKVGAANPSYSSLG